MQKKGHKPKCKDSIWYAGAWRTEKGIEERRKRGKERKRNRSTESKAKDLENRRNKYANDPEYRARCDARGSKWKRDNREKLNNKKREQRASNQEGYNEANRERYSRNKEKYRSIIYEGRRRRNPTYGLTKLIDNLKSGELRFDQVVGRVSEALDRLRERGDKEI